jgi:hypothetical protein
LVQQLPELPQLLLCTRLPATTRPSSCCCRGLCCSVLQLRHLLLQCCHLRLGGCQRTAAAGGLLLCSGKLLLECLPLSLLLQQLLR